jgi:hypothetical protein
MMLLCVLLLLCRLMLYCALTGQLMDTCDVLLLGD